MTDLLLPFPDPTGRLWELFIFQGQLFSLSIYKMKFNITSISGERSVTMSLLDRPLLLNLRLYFSYKPTKNSMFCNIIFSPLFFSVVSCTLNDSITYIYIFDLFFSKSISKIQWRLEWWCMGGEKGWGCGVEVWGLEEGMLNMNLIHSVTYMFKIHDRMTKWLKRKKTPLLVN